MNVAILTNRAMYVLIASLALIIGAIGYGNQSTARADWSPTPGPSPASNSFRLTASPWRLTPDGTWTTIVQGHFASPGGADMPLVHASVDWSASNGESFGLVRWTYSDPATLVTLNHSAEVIVTANPTNPQNRTARVWLPAPPDSGKAFASVVRAVGPHLVNIGWTPLNARAGVRAYTIYRRDALAPAGSLIASVSRNAHSYHDGDAWPGHRYRYTVVATAKNGRLRAISNAVELPDELPPTSLDSISGKGMFLYFSPDAADPEHGYPSYDIHGVMAQAKSAGVRNIELRMAYGSFFEAFSPAARAWLDRFIDAAADADIKLLAWEVPRRATTADIAEAVAVARYRTPEGNGFDGSALDIENGDDYMGDDAAVKQSMVDYIHQVRLAVGPAYLVVATVISPRLRNWTNADYPYKGIAPYASVMQPMEYWHYFYATSHHVYAQDGVGGAVAGAVTLTKQLAGRDIPVSVAGQSDDLGGTGVPSTDEIGWSLAAAKHAGAIGEMFFDWRGTPADRWPAIAAFPW